MPDKLMIIAGPTATGKSDLAVRLAKAYEGEIISADSVQVYKGMDIGSAKITKTQMEGVSHHLIDILTPDMDYSVADFCRMAKEKIGEITKRGHLPIVVGGTGFYIRALLYDTDFVKGEGDERIRAALNDYLEAKGPDALYERLLDIDPEYGATVHKNNIKRVMRAIEYYELSGEKFSSYNERESRRKSPYDFRYYVLTAPRELLYERINQRVDKMMDMGLLEEVRGLKEQGYGRRLKSMQSIGYKEIYDYLEGDVDIERAVYNIKLETRHFAKRQLTWFKRDRDAEWIDICEADPYEYISAGS